MSGKSGIDDLFDLQKMVDKYARRVDDLATVPIARVAELPFSDAGKLVSVAFEARAS